MQKSALPTTVLQYLDYAHRELNLTHKTLDNYKRELQKFSRTTTAQYVEDLTVEHLNNYFRYEEDRGLKISSVNTARRTMRSLIHYCQYVRRLDMNVDYTVIRQKKEDEPRKIKYATSEEVEEILDALQYHQDRLIVITIYCAGLRISELVRLRVEDIRESELFVRGKGNKGRVVPIPQSLHVALLDHVYERSFRAGAIFQHKVTKHSLVHKGYSVSGIRNRFIRLLRPHGLYPSFHWYRHGIATSLYDDGADLRFIQDFLGHSDIRTTQIYTHVTAKRKRESYDKHFPREFNLSAILDKSAQVC